MLDLLLLRYTNGATLDAQPLGHRRGDDPTPGIGPSGARNATLTGGGARSDSLTPGGARSGTIGSAGHRGDTFGPGGSRSW